MVLALGPEWVKICVFCGFLIELQEFFPVALVEVPDFIAVFEILFPE